MSDSLCYRTKKKQNIVNELYSYKSFLENESLTKMGKLSEAKRCPHAKCLLYFSNTYYLLTIVEADNTAGKTRQREFAFKCPE